MYKYDVIKNHKILNTFFIVKKGSSGKNLDIIFNSYLPIQEELGNLSFVAVD